MFTTLAAWFVLGLPVGLVALAIIRVLDWLFD